MSAQVTARTSSLEKLNQGTFDVLVIGAGIIGARVAYEAARVGLRVALIDAGDFGGATSSASGKLVHGGLRYLKTGNVRLVREAQRERRALTHHIAPHLVHPLPFLLAVSRRGPHGPLGTAAGLLAYAALAGFGEPVPRFIPIGRARSLVPPLRAENIGACALLQEAQTNDSRLTLNTVKAAVRKGAVVVNHLRVVDLERFGGRIAGALLEGRDGEGSFTVHCRVVVNATGPWVDHLRRLEDPTCEPLARLSKGVHVMLPLGSGWRAAVGSILSETRAIYALPWQGMLLLGTTDTAYEGDPGAVVTNPGDIASLLEDAARILPEEMLRPEQVRFSFAGLRVLPLGDGDTARASRAHVLSVGPGGMISVAGGKLTTHRRIALDVLRKLPGDLTPRTLRPSDEPLPGTGRLPHASALGAWLEAPILDHLLHLYGSEVIRLHGYAALASNAFERIHPRGPDIWAQVYYAVEKEWALTVEDIVRRRTTLSIRGLATEHVCTRIASVLKSDKRTESGTATGYFT